MTATDPPYSYLAPSTVASTDAQLDLALSTSGGTSRHPHFFSGFVRPPRQSAQTLLVVAAVARTRFYETAAMVRARILAADPIVTSGGGRLRFEALSPLSRPVEN